MKTPVFIVADDLGLSAEVNLGTAAAFEAGMLAGASLMVNTAAADDACVLARQRGFHDRLGLHINLAEGRPLTAPIAEHEKFCRDGTFVWPRQPCWSLTKREQQAVEFECEAQYRRCRDMGIQPVRIDSHCHVHKHWPVSTILFRLALEWGVHAVRLAVNADARPAWHPKRLYGSAFNFRVRRRGLDYATYFGDMNDVRALLGTTALPVEIMVHPYIDRRGKLHNLYGPQRRSLAAEVDAIAHKVVIMKHIERLR